MQAAGRQTLRFLTRSIMPRKHGRNLAPFVNKNTNVFKFNTKQLKIESYNSKRPRFCFNEIQE
jgi:hypothetical protein